MDNIVFYMLPFKDMRLLGHEEVGNPGDVEEEDR